MDYKKAFDTSRRKHERVSAVILLDLAPIDSLAKKSRGCMVDLSLGGLAVESEGTYPMDKELLLSINLPIRIVGKIVRKERKSEGNLYSYGIEYARISFFDKLRLKKYVKALIKVLTGGVVS